MLHPWLLSSNAVAGTHSGAHLGSKSAVCARQLAGQDADASRAAGVHVCLCLWEVRCSLDGPSLAEVSRPRPDPVLFQPLTRSVLQQLLALSIVQPRVSQAIPSIRR
jgi:hypothetical protein